MQQLEEFAEIRRKIQKNRGVIQVTGCIDPQKPHFISCSAQGYSHRVIITYSDLRAKELYENYRFFDREKQVRDGDTVLVKASHFMHFEKIVDALAAEAE